MKALITTLMMCWCLPVLAQPSFTTKTITDQLTVPWEIEWGPDGKIWMTERSGVVSRVDVETGIKDTILDDRIGVIDVAECGMLGFDWHPDYPDSPYIYIAAVYGEERPTYRLVQRYTIVTDNDDRMSLVDPVEILRESSVNYSHQGCRIKVGPDRKLWVTTGDNFVKDGLLAQDLTNHHGKVLRMNLDGSVPSDNPFPDNLIWSYGHRNVQGLVHLPNGTIFTAEHGANIEDEVNLLRKGANYGWPYIEGYCDEEYEMDFCRENETVEPAYSSGREYTYAMAGLDYYDHPRYPSLRGSLFLATLKWGTLFQLHLNDARTSVTSATTLLQRSIGRIRDIAISPDGRIFLSTSNREPLAKQPFPLPSDDRIVELLPIKAGVKGEISTPDTIFTYALPGDELAFYGSVTNVGNGPVTIADVSAPEGWPVILAQHWYVPFVIDPSVTYKVHLLFAPKEEGVYRGTMRIKDASGKRTDVPIVASTKVGYLASTKDTVIMEAPVSQFSTIEVVYTNRGLDAVVVDSFYITNNVTGNFSIERNFTGTVQPRKSCTVILRYDASVYESSACLLRVASSSYKNRSVLVIGHQQVISVEEGDYGSDIAVYPNPFVDELIISTDNLPTGTISVIDLLGNTVWEAPFTDQSTITWNGRSSNGAPVAPGTYFVMCTGPTISRRAAIQKIGW
jgi:aldose sugar dehydrogenase